MEQVIHPISVTGYQATFTGNMGRLVLGTCGSYGVEQIQLMRGADWADLVVTANFVTGEGTTAVVVPQSGRIDVPPEATARQGFGALVLQGTADDVQIYTVNIPFVVLSHAELSEQAPAPTPDRWEQFVAQVQSNADRAEKAASVAEAALEKVQDAGAAALTAIGTAQTTATQAVEQSGTEEVEKVDKAGDAKIQKIEELNALLPAPTADDVGKAVVVKPDGGGYALGNVQVDAYTKARSDARYAPIEAAIKVSGSGTGLVSLSPTVGWYHQGLALYGRAWQNGTPSMEQEAAIQDAGQSGSVDVTVAGKQLFPLPQVETSFELKGLSFFYKNGNISISGSSVGDAWINLYPTVRATTGTSDVGAEIDGRFAVVSSAANFTISFRKKSGTVPHNIRSGEMSVELNNPVVGCFLYFPAGTSVSWSGTLAILANDESIPSEYIPYTAQQLPIPTPDGLPGIPVTSGGNWVDETGQAWVSNVVDLVAKENTQNCMKETLSGTPKFKETSDVSGRFMWLAALKNIYKNGEFASFSTFGKFKAWSTPTPGTDTFAITANTVYYSPSTPMTDEEVNAKFAEMIASENPPAILGQLATPITTTLDESTVATYRALASYPGTTNILAPDCGIQASAVGDGTAILADIKDKISALQSAAVDAYGGML